MTNLLIAGGTGYLGSLISKAFPANGYVVKTLSRDPKQSSARCIYWDGETSGKWLKWLEWADVLLNLCGRSVDCRYHSANKKAIFNSRVLTTRTLAKAIETSAKPPLIWLQMSTATIYNHTYGPGFGEDSLMTYGHEQSAPSKWQFSVDVAKAWEAEALRLSSNRVRQVLLRTAMVMGPQPGSAYEVLRRLSKWGLGGKTGHGRQYVSWIHQTDFLNAIDYLIKNEKMTGPVNLSAPNPIPNQQFMSTLRDSLAVRIGLPTPKWLLELGCFLLRTESELVLKSRKVLPHKLENAGFHFQFPDWPKAAANLNDASIVKLDGVLAG